VLKRLLVPLLTCCALLALSVSSATAGTPHVAKPNGWSVTLASGQTTGTFTTAMDPKLCATLLASHPDRSRADCFTHHRLALITGAQPPVRSDNLVLASYACRIGVQMSMWNYLWWAQVTAWFCVDYGRYVYSYYVDCYSNYGVYPGESIKITWCGPGAAGYNANGGDNVWVSSVYGGAYAAGQRAGLSAWYTPSDSCWNAYCN
jgi:hypothetical protein